MTIYTDGACLGNPGPGGWGWYVLATGESDSGGELSTTNNRMELVAVIEAIKVFDGDLEIRSDSKYIVDCFNQKWYEGWIKRGWKTSKKEPVKNKDLWQELFGLVLDEAGGSSAGERRVEFVWVEGHSDELGDDKTGNDEADKLALEAAQKMVK